MGYGVIYTPVNYVLGCFGGQAGQQWTERRTHTQQEFLSWGAMLRPSVPDVNTDALDSMASAVLYSRFK